MVRSFSAVRRAVARVRPKLAKLEKLGSLSPVRPHPTPSRFLGPCPNLPR